MTKDAALFEYLCRLGDNTLILGHRVSEWCGHAPVLEEDIALANTALDLIGQTQLWLGLAGEVEGKGRSADDLAYLRDAWDFRNILMVERPNGDFAHTMLRQLYFAAFMEAYWTQCLTSSDETIRAIAAKAIKEVAYHIRHAGEWVIRLGDGTEESARRMAAAVDALHRYTGELFQSDAVTQEMAEAGVAPDPSSLRTAFEQTIGPIFAAAGLALPESDEGPRGGRAGLHGEEMGHLLAELQYMQRTYPGAAW